MSDLKYKGVVLIVDGLGDLPVESLRGQTPLEAAHTPSCDGLAAAGKYGLVDPIAPGVTPNTHSGAGVLLGLLPDFADVMMRGPIEAAGVGRALLLGEIALRANFATVNPSFGGFLVTDRRAGRVSDGVAELAEALNHIDLGDGIKAEFLATDQHRGVLILSGEDLSAAVSDTDPGDEEMPAPVLRCQALLPEARRTADKVNLFLNLANERLQNHTVNIARAVAGKPAANGIITRGAGGWVELQNRVVQQGLKAAVVSACNTVSGLGREFGFEVISKPGFTGGVDTDIKGKMQAALESLQHNDLVFVHFKAPDVCAHDRKPEAKRDFLERLDQAIGHLLQKKLVTGLAADHTTDSNTGAHTADPIPALIYSPDHGLGLTGINFSEKACKNGTMQRQTSSDYLQQVLAAMHGQSVQ